MIPDAAPGGRPRKIDKREVIEAILYVLRVGCAWRLLPHDFPPWRTTTYHYFRRWERERMWAGMRRTLVMAAREREGRSVEQPFLDPLEGEDDPTFPGLFGQAPPSMSGDRKAKPSMTCLNRSDPRRMDNGPLSQKVE